MSASIRESATPLSIINLGTVDYQDTWIRQAEDAMLRAEEKIPDEILFVEHPATYTAGKRTQPEDRPQNGTPVIDVDRGGRITWHGPGQLVGYPIIKLAQPLDVVDYVRRIEQAVISACHSLGLHSAQRVEGRSGVWFPAGVLNGILEPERKVCAIGIRVTRGVTMHGFALNCNNSLEDYTSIVPCGITDAGVTTLSKELGREICTSEAEEILLPFLQNALSGELPVSFLD